MTAGSPGRVTLYVNVDSQEIHTRARCAGTYDEDTVHLRDSGSHAQAATFEQWLDQPHDLGLLVVEMDDI